MGRHNARQLLAVPEKTRHRVGHSSLAVAGFSMTVPADFRIPVTDVSAAPDGLLAFPRAQRMLALVAWGDAEGVNTYHLALDGPPGPRVSIGGRPHLMLSSYDYLGLAAHPDVIAAAEAAVREHGAGTGGVRLLTGTATAHHALESRLSAWLGAEDTLVAGSGFLANLAVVPEVVGPGDRIVADELVHRSVADACQLSRASLHRFRHGDLDALEGRLAEPRGRRRGRTLVIIDGVYSMEGDVAPLRDCIALKERYGAFLMVDEAHALGTLGATGRGSTEHAGVDPESVDIRTGSLSKALGSQGGFVAGSRRLIRYLKHDAPAYIFSGALAPAATGAALRALDVLAREPERLARLRANARRLRAGLRHLGLLLPEHPTPIIPVPLGRETAAWQLARRLLRRGAVALPVTHPAVPRGKARLRLCAMASHREADIEEALAAFAGALQEGELDAR